MRTNIAPLLLSATCAAACAHRPFMTTAATGETPAEVMVHVETNEPTAVLARVANSATAIASGPAGTAAASSMGFEHICAGSCDVPVTPNQLYVFLGVSGFQGRSGSFLIPPQDKVTLRVDSGSQGMWLTGWVTFILGGTGVVSGGAMWATGAAVGASQDGLATAGEITTLISLPVLAFGIWAMVSNHTSVTTEGGGELAHTKRGLGVTARGLAYRF